MLITGIDETAAPPVAPPQPIDAVLFDFSNTIFHCVDTVTWLRATAEKVGAAMGIDDATRLKIELEAAWHLPGVIAAQAARDTSEQAHRDAVLAWVGAVPALAPLAAALNDQLRHPDSWIPYDDTAPVLAAVRARGLRVGVVSNIGWNIRPYFSRHGLEIDAVALSCEVGVEKPDPALFRAACRRLDVPPEHTLMVGDTPNSDGGAARLGMRAYVLPAGGELALERGLSAVISLLDGQTVARDPRG